MFTRKNFVATVLSILFLAVISQSAKGADKKPVLLYSRYFNAAGENRYLPEGNYTDILKFAREAGFELQVHSNELSNIALKGVDVVLIANPSDKAAGTNATPHHFDAREVEQLVHFVKAGGGLILMGNQENHNVDVAGSNRLLKNFGLELVDQYTDAKPIRLGTDHPLFPGLTWAYYTGDLVLLDPKSGARPRVLIANDKTTPLGGPRNQEGALMAGAEPGKGRVVVVTDAGWLTNEALNGKGIGSVAIKGHDNFEIFRRMVLWAGGGLVPVSSPK
ncbi:MAG: hypothetical protein JWN25_3618 [Verrucomicrobiales bacterium]|nr:hypothetical protein [Verrucomicrobiales bacterium]